jgi:hypothetical protein
MSTNQPLFTLQPTYRTSTMLFDAAVPALIFGVVAFWFAGEAWSYEIWIGSISGLSLVAIRLLPAVAAVLLLLLLLRVHRATQSPRNLRESVSALPENQAGQRRGSA